MTSPALIELRDLTERESAQADPKTRVVLSRVALEVNGRLQEGSPGSAEYMGTVISALKRIKGTANAELRANCLIDAAHYFYLVGQSFSAIEPSSEAVTLATATGHKSLLRKALTLLGIMYADTGNISRAIECYAQALDLTHELHDVDGESIVWVNLGVALLYAAQYRDAISCFE